MKPLKVSEVNNYIKRLFTSDMILSNIEVEGEISNYNKHYSGHAYFSLKDKNSRIKCVLFRSNAKNINTTLIEGQKVIAKGYISIYEKNGDYQLYVKDIYDKGVGRLYQEYEILKKKLESEGLFKDKYKKDLPSMPEKIGVITSASGAALRDILTVINRRYPICNILIYPSLVQGEKAHSNLIQATRYLDNREDIDLIILARGGGSIDELFVFNNEKLARTIFQSKTPIISAVGHETDFTISDFVADLRAATPSIAAELSTPNIEELLRNLNNKYSQLIYQKSKKLETKHNELKILSRELKYNSPLFKIRDKRQELDSIFRDIDISITDIIDNQYKVLLDLEKQLKLLDPSISLKDGSGILVGEDGSLLKSAKELAIDQVFKIIMQDGTIEAIVKSIDEGNEY